MDTASQSANRFVRKFRFPSQPTGLIVAVVSSLILAGWALNIAALKSIVPGFLATPASTALAFALAGVALTAKAFERANQRLVRITQAYSLAVGILGLLTLAEYIFGWNFGIDQFLFREQGATVYVGTFYPGRMPVVDAVNLALIGSALLLLRSPRNSGFRASRVLTFLVYLSGTFSFVGYLYQTYSATATPDSAIKMQMAFPTAMLCMILSIGMLFVRSERAPMAIIERDTIGGVISRRLLSAAITMPFLLGWLALIGQQKNLYGEETGQVLFATSVMVAFVTLIWWNARMIDRLDRRRRRAEEVLTHLAAIVESSDDAIIGKTLDGVITSWNAGAEQIFGYSAGEVIGQPISILFPADRLDELPDILQRIKRDEHIDHYQTVRTRKDSKNIDVSVAVSPIRNPFGEVIGASAITRDISQQKQVEEQRTAKEAAEAANRAKTEFLSYMSHELRTPLNSVLGFAQLLGTTELTEAQQNFLRYIVKSGSHILDLSTEILDISRIEAGNMAISIEQIELDMLLEECLELVRPAAAKRNLQLNTNRCLDNARGRYILADRQRLRQVLLNLLSNAIKYNSEEGKVSVRCEQREQQDGRSDIDTIDKPDELSQGRIRVSIADTGAGIPPDQLTKLFTPFERLGVQQRDIEGTGLGLALSKNLMEAMGGSIGVESKVGRGCVFWVEMLLAETPAPVFDSIATGISHSVLDAQVPQVYIPGMVEDNVSNSMRL